MALRFILFLHEILHTVQIPHSLQIGACTAHRYLPNTLWHTKQNFAEGRV